MGKSNFVKAWLTQRGVTHHYLNSASWPWESPLELLSYDVVVWEDARNISQFLSEADRLGKRDIIDQVQRLLVITNEEPGEHAMFESITLLVRDSLYSKDEGVPTQESI